MVVTCEPGAGDSSEHSFHFAFPNLWRVEFVRGKVWVNDGIWTVVREQGREVERVPARRWDEGLQPAFRQLVVPYIAPVWGRPQDDWAFTGPIEDLGDNRVLLPIHHTEAPLTGEVEADLNLGILTRIRLPYEETCLHDFTRYTPLPADTFHIDP